MTKSNYDPKYIKYGFPSIDHKAEILPQCVVCLKTLCNAAMKPSLPKCHLESNHLNRMNVDGSCFQRLAGKVSVNVRMKRVKRGRKAQMLLQPLLRLPI